MARITDLQAASALASGDVFAIDNPSGSTKKATPDLIKNYAIGTTSISSVGDGTVTGAISNIAGRLKDNRHNMMLDYRVMGAATNHASLLPADKIADGSFDGIYPGQMLTCDLGSNLIVAGCDLFRTMGDNISLGHHVVLTFAGIAGTGQMNTTNAIGDKGYATIRALTDDGTVGARLAAIKTRLTEIFGDRLMSYRAVYPNAYTDGVATGLEWADACVELMTEAEVYGTNVWSSSGYETGIDKSQFPIFRLMPELTTANRDWYWLRNVRSASAFAFANGDGRADGADASNVHGVRPFFLIK